MKIIKIQIYLGLLSLIIINLSCTRTVYSPSSKGTFTVYEQGQILASGGLGVSPNYLNINFEAGYSPIENIGMQLNFENSHKYSNIGLALGCYKAKYLVTGKEKTGFHFDGYLGYSINEASGRANSFQNSFFYNEFNYNVNYQDIYIATGIHFFWKVVGIDIVYKPHLLDIYKLNINGDISDDLISDYETLAKRPFVVSDITTKLNIGNNNFQIFGAINICWTQSNVNYFMDPYSLTAGVNVNINNLIYESN